MANRQCCGCGAAKERGRAGGSRTSPGLPPVGGGRGPRVHRPLPPRLRGGAGRPAAAGAGERDAGEALRAGHGPAGEDERRGRAGSRRDGRGAAAAAHRGAVVAVVCSVLTLRVCLGRVASMLTPNQDATAPRTADRHEVGTVFAPPPPQKNSTVNGRQLSPESRLPDPPEPARLVPLPRIAPLGGLRGPAQRLGPANHHQCMLRRSQCLC